MEKLLLFIGVGLVASVLVFNSLTLAAGQTASNAATTTAGSDKKILAQRLANAITFQTVSHEDSTKFNEKAFRDFQKYLERTFPKVHASMKKETVGDYSLLFTWQGRNHEPLPVLLAAHMDVVPVGWGTEGGWTYPPFQGRIADGFIWGRGTLDDKVSILGILEATEKLLQAGFVPRRTIYLAFGHDEEIGGLRGAAKIAELLHSRGVKLDYVLDEGLTITEGMVPNIAKPVALIGIAEKGSLSLELSVEGTEGHSSMPPPQTVIGTLSAAISRLEHQQFPARMEAPVKKMFEALAPEMPLGMKVVFSNLWLFEGLVNKKLTTAPRTNAIIRTTIAPTIFQAGVKENILPAKATAIVNYRILPGDTIDTVLQNVRKTINDPRVEITVLEKLKSEPSNIADIESQGYRAVEQAIRKVFPETLVAPGLVVAVTDSRHYSTLTGNIFHFSPIRLRSEDLQRIHGTDERISIENYDEAVRFYAQLIRNEGMM